MGQARQVVPQMALQLQEEAPHLLRVAPHLLRVALHLPRVARHSARPLRQAQFPPAAEPMGLAGPGLKAETDQQGPGHTCTACSFVDLPGALV